MANYTISLNWRDIKQAIQKLKSSNDKLWFWQRQLAKAIQQLQDLINWHNEEQNTDQYLNENQLFEVARVLVRHHSNMALKPDFRPVIQAYGDHRIEALQNLYQAGGWRDWLSSITKVIGGALLRPFTKINNDHARNYLKNGLMNQQNLNKVLQHNKPADLNTALDQATQNGLLQGANAQANFDAIAGHSNPESMANVLVVLNRDQSLPINEKGLVNHDDPSRLVDSSYREQRIQQLDGVNPHRVNTILDLLQMNNLDISANFNNIISHSNLMDLEIAVQELDLNGMLNQNFLNVIANHSDPEALADILKQLNAARLLEGDQGQTNLNRLTESVNRWLTSEEAKNTVWNVLPRFCEQKILQGV